MAGGERGVDRALSILRDQVIRTMRLLGVTSLDELTPDHAIIRPRDPQTDAATT
jgi:L-lactate dehydrogenase (cytochrome)